MGVWASERESDCENAFYHRHELRTVSIITSAIGMKLLSISHRKLHKHARTHSFHIRFEQKKQQQQRWWWQQQRHQQQIMAINHTNVEKKSCYRNSSIQLTERASEREAAEFWFVVCARCDSFGRTMLSLCLLVRTCIFFSFLLSGLLWVCLWALCHCFIHRFLRFFLCTTNATRIMIMIMMVVVNVVVGGGGGTMITLMNA